MRFILPTLLIVSLCSGCGRTWSDKDLVFVNVDQANALFAQSDGTWLKPAGPNIWVDARNAETYARGHVPGAINLPLRNVDTQWARLKDHGTVIVYAATYNDPIADAQSKALMEKGIDNVKTLTGGWKAWLDSGGEVDRGPDPGLVANESVEATRIRRRRERTSQQPY
jgi:rhodanese-related sulfurtransferase